MGAADTGRHLGRTCRLLATTLVVTAASLAAFAGSASASGGPYKVMIADATSGCGITTFPAQLAAEPGIARVDTFNASAATPTDAQLEQYDMVVTDSDCGGFSDPVAIGNNLADYLDQGGVVVEYAYGMETSSDEIQGRWLSGGYSPYVPGTNVNNAVTLGAFEATSPLMAGVSSLTAEDDTNATLALGATSVALWNTGVVAVAYKGRAVGVQASVEDEAVWSGDYARLTLNAMTWFRPNLAVSKSGTGSGTVTSTPAGISCGATCSANYSNGSTVTLTASPASGSTFAGWSGAGCSGTETCTVTMDAARAVTGTFNAIPPPQPIKISGATETHKMFRVSASPKLAQISKKLAPIGTTFKFTLNGAAKARFDFTEPGAGRNVGGKCVAATNHNKHKAKCTLLAGSSTFSGHAGTNKVAFEGWLSHSKKLKPGHYTLVITAITPGVGTTTAKLNFTVVK